MPEIQFHQKKGILVWNGTDWVPAAANVDGELIVEATIGDVNIDSADGAIVDGASAAIRATVFDYVGSNPIAVTLVDETGAQYNAGGGAASTVELEEQLDYDSGAGTVPVSVVGIALPGSGGPVAGGTTTNPIQIADAGGNISIDDGGNTITVDGTVAVTNGGLTELAAAINGSSQMDVNIAASNATITVASHAVTNAGTFATQVDGAALTALQLIDDPVAVLGTATYTEAATKGMIAGAVRRDADTTLVDTTNEVAPLQVDARGALKVEAFSGETLPVSLASVPSHAVTNAGTFAVQVDGSALTSLQLIDDIALAEDAVHNSGDKGVMALAVRQDAQADFAADGDYVPFSIDADGGLRVSIIAGAGSGGTAIADDAAFTVGTTNLTPVGGIYKGTLDSVDDGDAGAFAMTAKRALHTLLVDTNGDPVSVGGGTQYTEDAAAAANPVGTAVIMVRADSLAGVTTTDGDNVAARGTDKGELYVKHVDAIPVTDNGGALTVDGTVAVTNAGLTELAAAINGSSQMDVNIAASNATVTVANGGTFVVQENGAALTALQLIDDPVVVLGTATYTEAASKGMLIGAVRRDADTTLVDTTNEFAPLQVDAAGKLKVEVFDGGDSHTVDNGGTFVVQENGAALTALQLIDDGVYTDDTSTHATGTSKGYLIMAAATPTDGSVNANDIGAVAMTTDRKLHVSIPDAVTVSSHAVTNAGTFAVQVDGNALTALQLIDDPVVQDDAAFTPGTTKVMMAGFQADESSTDSVDEGDGGAARMTLDRKVIVNPQPHTAGGLSTFRSLDLDETEEDVKTSAGQIYGYHFMNRTTSPLYLKIYNATAANTTVGSTTPILTLEMPANASDHVGGHLMGAHGIAFDTAICAAVTTGFADADTGAPAANAAIVHIWYK